MEAPELVPSGFFVLRAALLPFSALRTSTGDERAWLGAACADPLFRAALQVASPELDRSVPSWLEAPESERGQKVERGLLRYLSRMAARATPYGLCAGWALGTLGRATSLELLPRSQWHARARLDMGWLTWVAGALAERPEVLAHLTLETNPAVLSTATGLRYVEWKDEGQARTYHLVEAAPAPYLLATLERARAGARLDSLGAALEGEGVSGEEAREYVRELVAAKLLLPDLTPSITGPEPAGALAAALASIPGAAEAASALGAIQDELEAVASCPLEQVPEQLDAARARMAALPEPPSAPDRFQVDLSLAARAELGEPVIRGFARGIELLRRITPHQEEPALAKFREAFVDRFGEREVPLLEALDAEAGIGFGEGGSVAPLLAGLPFPEAAAAPARWPPPPALLALLERGRAGGEVELGPADLDALAAPHPAVLPDALAILCTLEAENDEAHGRSGDPGVGRARSAPPDETQTRREIQIHLHSVSGPSGARLLGRFCHASPELAAHVQRHLRSEEALRPEAIFAEVVHLPEGRNGNVLLRPVLRDWELPLLGGSGAPRERQLLPAELTVSVRDGRVVLFAPRLGKEVVPRLTAAHHHAHEGNLALYRFLCALQDQGVAPVLSWRWGALAEAPALPRVRSGRLVLARAQWNLGPDRLGPLARADREGRRRLLAEARGALRLPRWIGLADGDQVLPVDLDSRLLVDSLAHALANRPRATLVELPDGERLAVRGPGGRFAHELLVPFVQRRASRPAAARSRSWAAHAPGSEWLYAKLYTGTATADHLLRELVAPWVRGAQRWFFIRYGDPSFHLRVRVRGDPRVLWSERLPALHAATAPWLSRGAVQRLQVDTYDPEVHRYGGLVGVEVAEQLFQADSEAVLDLLGVLAEAGGDAAQEQRWRLAMLGLHAWLEDLGLSMEARRSLLQGLRDNRAAEFGVAGEFERALSDRFRRERSELDALLRGTRPEALQVRSARAAPLVAELRALEQRGELSAPVEVLAESFLHMHCNRLIREESRRCELVLFDFLARLYDSARARGQPY